MIFKIPENASYRGLKILPNNDWHRQRRYTRDDLSKTVSFFLDYLNRIPNEQSRRIGIVYGALSFLSIAFMLALIKSKRDYIVFYHLDNFDIDLTTVCNHIFIAGDLPETVNKSGLQLAPDFFTEIWNYDLQKNAFAHTGQAKLEFEFDANQKTFIGILRDGSWTTIPLYTTGKIEESCIVAAMDNYISEEDTCILVRPFRHIGVATLSIYPALFKAKKVIICRGQEDWNDEYKAATNVHLAWEMVKENWKLPEKLRMVTTGGYAFNSDCINYVVNQSDVEHIVDCYGTAVCPPPMAIRYLHKDRPAFQPFVWINKLLKPKSDNGNLAITGPVDIFKKVQGNVPSDLLDFDKVLTSDKIELTDNGFYFYGSRTMFIRVKHERWTVDNFSNLFKEQTGIEQFEITFEDKDGVAVPLLHVENQYKEIVSNFITNVFAEIILVIKH